MRLLIWGAVLPAFMVVAWMFLRRPFRLSFERMHVDHARELFHQQREWLEARFLKALATDRPRRGAPLGRRPLARRGPLGTRPADAPPAGPDRRPFRFRPLRRCARARPRHATALFEFRKGRWMAEGKRLDELRPDEAVLRHRRFEPVVLHLRPGDSPSPR